MPISQTMAAKLNEQITNEFFASQTYLAISCMFEEMGLKMLAKLYRQQTEEERGHALKILDYLPSVEAKIELAPIPKPTTSYPTVLSAIEAALEHERKVTAQFNELMTLAEKEKDYATRAFLQWFITEQVEEVDSQNYLLQLAKMVGERYVQLEGAVAHMLK